VPSVPESELRLRLIAAIRLAKPDILFSWYPYPRFDLPPSQGWGDLGYHPDHQAVGKLVLDSWFDSGVARVFPDSGAPWRPSEFT